MCRLLLLFGTIHKFTMKKKILSIDNTCYTILSSQNISIDLLPMLKKRITTDTIILAIFAFLTQDCSTLRCCTQDITDEEDKELDTEEHIIYQCKILTNIHCSPKHKLDIYKVAESTCYQSRGKKYYIYSLYGEFISRVSKLSYIDPLLVSISLRIDDLVDRYLLDGRSNKLLAYKYVLTSSMISKVRKLILLKMFLYRQIFNLDVYKYILSMDMI